MSAKIVFGLSLILIIFFLTPFSTVLGTPRVAMANPGTVTLTKHVNLGFSADIPISLSKSDSILGGILSYSVSFTGTAKLSAKIGTDIALSYDSADLVPSGSLPVTVTYTPTSGGSAVSFDVSGSATVDFTGCVNCPATVPFTLAAGGATFTAPMGADSPVTIAGTGSNVNFADIITAGISSALTLAPAGPGLLAGLGGAAAVVQVTGASNAPVLPIEWDSSGASQTFTLTLPATLAPIGISLGPVLHWFSTSGDVSIPLSWTSDFQDAVAVAADILSAGICLIADCSIPNPGSISVFSGGLGPVYSDAGLDTDIGSAVGGLAGPLVAARVASGFVPVPLTDPELASIPPIPSSLGSITFNIPVTTITGAPSDTILSGNSITLTASPSGGTAPFTYSWTKNGVPFGGSTSSITDTPSIGSTDYGLTVTDSLGAVSNTASVTVHVYDFTVFTTPASVQVLATGSNVYSVSLATVLGSYTTGLPTIGLSVSGLPTNATGSFSPGSGSLAFGSTLNITAVTATPGNYSITITGTDSRGAGIGGTRTSTVNLEIISSQKAISQVESIIQGFLASHVLNGGQANSLLTKLDHAIAKLNAGQYNTALNELQAFVNEVNAYVAGGKLTQAQANQLLLGPLGVLAIMASIPH